MVESLDRELEGIFSSRPEAMARAPEIWRRLSSQGPAFRHGPYILLNRYEDVRRMFQDLDSFATPVFSDSSQAKAESLRDTHGPDEIAAFFEVGLFEERFMNRAGDGTNHGRMRRVAHRYFTPARVAHLQESITRYADGLLDEISADQSQSHIDLVPFAYRLPLMVVSDLLGIPPEDRERVHAWSKVIGRNRRGLEPLPLMAARDAIREFRSYLEVHLQNCRRDREAAPPLVATLLAAEGDDTLADVETIAMLVHFLFAGHETTTNLIATGSLALLQHAQWTTLSQRPDLLPGATEELLRFVSPVQWLAREARREWVCGDVVVQPGDTLLGIIATANRDGSVFDDPNSVVLSRPNARAHLSFGFGIHHCLGHALARLEGQVAFEKILRRFPHAALGVDGGGLGWHGHAMLRSLDSLPVVADTMAGSR